MTKTFGEIANVMLSRRSFAKGLAAASALGFVNFPKLAKAEGLNPNLLVPEGINVQRVISWGDPIFPNVPPFDVKTFSLQNQLKSFGYNNDFMAYMPIDGSNRGLLCVNHETAMKELMFPDYRARGKKHIDIELASVGHSVVEVFNEKGEWKVNLESIYNRRFNNYNTEFDITGPAASKMQGKVIGTGSNCGGGITPWGTILFCEENVNLFLTGNVPDDMRISASNCTYDWNKFYSRFDATKSPADPFKFGWVIEYDPFDPSGRPKKRTALGRMMHEGAECGVAKDGRVVVYMGDDEEFQHIYKFVSSGTISSGGKSANSTLLDNGTLYCAQFFDNGKVKWLPIDPSQILCTRTAAKNAGATPMDRPEGIAINPLSQKVYIALTNNRDRTKADAANPRVNNVSGHIIELSPQDHADLEHDWSIFIMGDENMACPDNLTFDKRGRLWMTTDGMESAHKVNDGVYFAETEGENRGIANRFMAVPIGAEPCSPIMTPDEKTLFVCVQHPGEGSNYQNPSTRWPDFDPNTPPRPSVVAITRADGEKI